MRSFLYLWNINYRAHEESSLSCWGLASSAVLVGCFLSPTFALLNYVFIRKKINHCLLEVFLIDKKNNHWYSFLICFFLRLETVLLVLIGLKMDPAFLKKLDRERWALTWRTWNRTRFIKSKLELTMPLDSVNQQTLSLKLPRVSFYYYYYYLFRIVFKDRGIEINKNNY